MAKVPLVSDIYVVGIGPALRVCSRVDQRARGRRWHHVHNTRRTRITTIMAPALCAANAGMDFRY